MATEDKERERRAFLRDEYLLLQTQYEDYDRRSLTIKSWVSTGAVTGLALSFSSSHYLYIILIVVIMSAVFWYLETYWKLFQYALGDRIRIIEAFFRNDEAILVKNPVPFQIYNYWYKSYALDEPIYPYEKNDLAYTRPRSLSRRLFQTASQRFVYMPYAVIIILALGSCLLLTVLPASQPRPLEGLTFGIISKDIG